MKPVAVVVLLFGAALSAPSPQDYPDSSEVELIRPVDTGAGDDGASDGDDGVILVLRPSIFNRFPGFGGFSGFPGFGGANRGSGFPFGSSHFPSGSDDFDLRDLLGFGSPQTDDEAVVVDGEEGDAVCGPICQMFRLFEDQLNVMQGEIDTLATATNLSGRHPFFGNGGEYDVNNSTHEITVLPDGTKVHTNRTVIADKDEDGNRFFFHSVIHQSALSPTDEEEEEASAEDTSLPSEESSSPVLDATFIQDADPGLNEIEEASFNDDGVDTGLTE